MSAPGRDAAQALAWGLRTANTALYLAWYRSIRTPCGGPAGSLGVEPEPIAVTRPVSYSYHMSERNPPLSTSRDSVRKALLAALATIQAESDRPLPSLDDSLSFESVAGFDSWAAEEMIVLIEAELGVQFPGRFQPFFDADGKARTLAEVTDAVERHVTKSKRTSR